MAQSDKIHQLRIAEAQATARHVFIRDLVLEADIGVHAHEKGKRQNIRINIDLAVAEGPAPLNDSLANTVCYESIIEGIKKIIKRGHVSLAETLAEEIAAMALTDDRVNKAKVQVEKLDAVSEAESVGVAIERSREDSP